MSKNAVDLFPLLAPHLKSSGTDYCIGGAVAMSAHGFVRQTEDLDVFIKHTDTPKLLRALNKAKVNFATIAEPYHYAIIPSAKNLDHRIDILCTSEELEMDAVEFPESATIDGQKVEVFPLTLLVATKARSDRPKDHDDVRRMYERGLFDVNEIIPVLKHYGEDKPKAMLRAILGEKVVPLKASKR